VAIAILQVLDMLDWRLAVAEVDKTVNIDYLDSEPERLGSGHSIGVDLISDDTHQKVVYFSAPPTYLDNKLVAYGGALNYSIFYTTGPFGKIAFCPLSYITTHLALQSVRMS
jgi:laminin alpha 3/5